jgi:hypothetical protein
MVYNNLITIAKEKGVELDPQAYTKAVTESMMLAATTQDNTQGSAKPATAESAYAESTQLAPQQPRPQHLRAYNLWHHKQMPLARMCAILRTEENPLKESTVMFVNSSPLMPAPV